MKLTVTGSLYWSAGPAPQGAGGLKSVRRRGNRHFRPSRPARGGWIEITITTDPLVHVGSRPARGGWIEITITTDPLVHVGSRPARGGWIEMLLWPAIQRGRPSRAARGGWIEIPQNSFVVSRKPVPPRVGRDHYLLAGFFLQCTAQNIGDGAL